MTLTVGCTLLACFLKVTLVLRIVGQYDHGQQEKYSSRDRDDYRREKDYYRDEYRRSDRDSEYRRSSSRRYRDRSRERRRGRSRSRDRHHHHHRSSRRGEDDYRRRRESSPHRRRRSSSRRDRDENVVPLHKRERKLNNWDVAPAGMEGMTAQQVKQTGKKKGVIKDGMGMYSCL